jgi:hypothetical protein
VLRLEGVGLLARGEVVVLDLVAGPLQQVLGLQAVGAGVVRHHHAVDDRLLRHRGRLDAGERMVVADMFGLLEIRSARI